MIARRDLILGAAALAGAGLAAELKPRRHVLLLDKNSKMESIVPVSFGDWSAASSPNLVTPDTKGKLASQLYSELVTRIYTHAKTGREVMMLIAYGDTQSDLLQLHRPESCYPAVGFSLKSSAPRMVPLAEGTALPGRRVVAAMTERQENIVYWTRLGEYLPTSSGQQRMARLRSAMKGVVPDGALFRCSMATTDTEASFRDIEGFVREVVLAVAPQHRAAVVGTALADALNGQKAV